MTVSDTSQAILAAHVYIRQFMTLDKEGFDNSLADEASYLRTRMRDGFSSERELFVGKEEVSEAYQKYFFSNPKNIGLNKIFVEGLDLHATIIYKAEVDEIEEGELHRRHRICITELDLKKEENNVIKIVKIWEKISKNLT